VLNSKSLSDRSRRAPASGIWRCRGESRDIGLRGRSRKQCLLVQVQALSRGRTPLEIGGARSR
jgi:hypothetical protein